MCRSLFAHQRLTSRDVVLNARELGVRACEAIGLY